MEVHTEDCLLLKPCEWAESPGGELELSRNNPLVSIIILGWREVKASKRKLIIKKTINTRGGTKPRVVASQKCRVFVGGKLFSCVRAA